MYKKSLFLGAAGLTLFALLVLFAFVGCSNPSSSDGGGVPQAGGVGNYPPGTVFTDDFDALVGLLNNPSTEDTNQVTHVVFTDTLTDELDIPGGKTVYLTQAHTPLTANIIVRPGAVLVLQADIQTADAARLLVKGRVEVYEELEVTATPPNEPALQVADYFEADGIISARGTVIGTPLVLVGQGGILTLTAADISNDPASANRFTPVQAWAAAGQGHLQINGSLTPTYTVGYLLEGITPSWDRVYIVETDGGDRNEKGEITLPSIIPPGAIISAHGVIEDALGHTLTVNGILEADSPASTFKKIETLTVNGQLTANFATFESVETLKISSLDNDNLTSRQSAPTLAWPTAWWGNPFLGADNATLEKAKSIIIGDNGEFATESTIIDLPEGAKISLGRSALFNAAGLTNNSFDNLTSLWIGPAATVTIRSAALTFKSLKTLTMQDSATLNANDAPTTLTFLVEPTPSTPPKKTEITWGLNSAFNVQTAPTAKVDVAINNDASLNSGTITVNDGSTFTVAPGKKLGVESGAAIDFSDFGGKTAPANAEAAPIKINGTIELAAGGTIIAPDPDDFPAANRTDIYKFASFGTDGKIVLNYGAEYLLGDDPLIGPSSSSYAYTWADSTGFGGLTTDGAQIEINGVGITIRDSANPYPVAVTVKAPGAYILKEQTLRLDTNVTLLLGNGQAIWFAGDTSTTGGAKLTGPGEVVAGSTTISGGSRGSWQVFGSSTETIGILQDSADTASITNLLGVGTPSFEAVGAGAYIKQAAGSGKKLTVGAATVVDLNGTSTTAGGIIELEGGSTGGQLELAAATSKLLLGAGTGGGNAAGTSPLTIGGKSVTSGGSFAVADFQKTAGGVLVQIGGANGGTLTAGTDNVTIASNAAFTDQ
jgi:hypothetical protein